MPLAWFMDLQSIWTYVPRYFEFTLVVYKFAYLSKNLTFPSRDLLSWACVLVKKCRRLVLEILVEKMLKLKRTFYTLLSLILNNNSLPFFHYKVDDCWLIHRANKVNLPVFYFCSNDFSSQNKNSHSNLNCVSYIFVTWRTDRRSAFAALLPLVFVHWVRWISWMKLDELLEVKFNFILRLCSQYMNNFRF